MKKFLKYKDFVGSIDFDIDEKMLFGEVLHTSDLIYYDGKDLEELQKSFEEAVDDYLELCKRVNKSPIKSFSGSFNCRVPSDVHMNLSMIAGLAGMSMNSVISNALDAYVATALSTRVPVIRPEYANLTRHIIPVFGNDDAFERLEHYSTEEDMTIFQNVLYWNERKTVKPFEKLVEEREPSEKHFRSWQAFPAEQSNEERIH